MTTFMSSLCLTMPYTFFDLYTFPIIRFKFNDTFLKDRRKGYDTIKDVEVAPQWIPDKETETCMRCRIAKFTLVNRRV